MYGLFQEKLDMIKHLIKSVVKSIKWSTKLYYFKKVLVSVNFLNNTLPYNQQITEYSLDIRSVYTTIMIYTIR